MWPHRQSQAEQCCSRASCCCSTTKHRQGNHGNVQQINVSEIVFGVNYNLKLTAGQSEHKIWRKDADAFASLFFCFVFKYC